MKEVSIVNQADLNWQSLVNYMVWSSNEVSKYVNGWCIVSQKKKKKNDHIKIVIML